MRYVIKEWAKDEHSAPKWEIGEKINGKKRILYNVDDFVIAQLDDSYLSDELFDAVSKLWKSGAPEERVKEFYKSKFHKENKDLYDYEFHALTEMRKKTQTKSNPKRKPIKKVIKKCKNERGKV